MIDDFTWTPFLVNNNDHTSTVTAPGTQLLAGTLSSINIDSVPVIQFVITDAASGDGLPTNVTGVYLVGGPNNTVDYNLNLSGGGVYDITNGAVIPLTGQPTVTSDNVYLPIALSVPDGGSVTIEGYVYINPLDAPDGAVLQFQINAASNGFTADVSGSDFEDPFAGGDIVGNDFTVDVVATQLTFLTQPTNVAVGSAISPAVEVGAVDTGGNVDVDYPLTSMALTFSGSGTMTGTNPVFMTSGIATYNDLTFDTEETGVTLDAVSAFTGATSVPFDITPVPQVAIINAYALNNIQIDVIYAGTVFSVDPADYTLTGSQTITFNSAVIDATDNTIVHLAGFSEPTVADVILDNLNDAANSSSFIFYAGKTPISYTNTANAPDTITQGYNATFSGVVTADDEYNQVWIQNSADPMFGVLIFDIDLGDNVDVGDSITIVGQKSFYNGASEIVNPILLALFSGSTAVPAIVNPSNLNYNLGQDDANAEPWEGQFVTVNNIIIDSLNTSFFEYYGHDCAGNLICFDDDVDYQYASGLSLTLGAMYDISGVVTFSFDHYKVNPRNITDATQIARDLTSVVEAPDVQTIDAILDRTLVVDSLNAVEIFKFKITDEGTDGLPTKLSQITIFAGPNNTIDLSGTDIANGWFDFGDAANPIVIAAEPTFTATQIDFVIDSESAIIDNGTSRDVSLHIWFDPAVADGSVVQVLTKSNTHGFISDCLNSQFADSFTSDVTGGSFTIQQHVNVNDT